jgi:hypothetical protein
MATTTNLEQKTYHKLQDGYNWAKIQYKSRKMLKLHRSDLVGTTGTNITSNLDNKKMLIYTGINGIISGGLNDRLRGIILLYEMSKRLGVDFRINYIYPVKLSDFLIPNDYDWRIEPSEIITNSRNAAFYHSIDNFLPHKLKDMFNDFERLFKHKTQIHCVTNWFGEDDKYATLFKELFKPSNGLQKLIDEHLSKIGNDFISVSFRFLNLLNDFDHDKYVSLATTEQQTLLEHCIQHLNEVHAENPNKTILVTSDSSTFITAIKELDYVYVIPGNIGHTDICNSADKNYEVYTKTLLDYFIISNAKKVYLISEGKMYANSGFAFRAALLGGSTFITKRYFAPIH